jgi:hypothetical protein
VTSRYFRESMLDAAGGVENPMLGFVDEYFLGPFDEGEATKLIRKLGRGMLLRWEDEALARVYSTTGGYPFLVRDLASRARIVARTDLTSTADEAIVTDAVVDTAVRQWRDAAAELWEQILQTLGHHHELMAEMVRVNNDADLVEWMAVGDDSERAARSLEGLGLLTRDGDGWRRSDSLLALQRLGRPAQAEAEALRERRERATDLLRLVDSGESALVEFKASARVNLHTGRPDEEMKRALVKSVAAFLNSEGGTLLVGVSDEREVVGLALDLESFGGSEDKLQRYVLDSLRQSLGDPTVASFVRVTLLRVSSEIICEISVMPDRHGVWCDDNGKDAFFVRNGNQTVLMRSREVAAYLTERSTR